MRPNKFQKTVGTFTLTVFLAVQVLMVSSGVLLPTKKADAFLGIGDTTIIIGNLYDILKTIGENILRQLAVRIAEKFLNQFINKLNDKYKIRNFLYYDQVLTNYYLSNFISDKVSDPELRKLFNLLNAGFVTGQPTGTTGGPNPQEAIIPSIRRSINNLYREQSGIDTNLLVTKPQNMSTSDFLKYRQSYFYNNVGYTQSSVESKFGEYQAHSTTASALEQVVGLGQKSGRISGTCNNGATYTKESCEAQGGSWSTPQGAVDQVKSIINDPGAYINNYLEGAIGVRLENNFGLDNYWAVVGMILGDFLFNKFFLDNNNNSNLQEDSNTYNASAPVPTPTTTNNSIDLDGDSIVDGYDTTGDNVVDVCVYGGYAPNCTGSVQASEPPSPPENTCWTSEVPVTTVNPITGETKTEWETVENCL
jgi:hypothetical protein